MKKIFYLLAFVCLFILNVKAQPLLQYSNTYSYPGTGSEFGISIAADDSGNAYVTGITDANGNNDIITIKYSPNGTKLWEKIYIGTGNDDDKPVKVMTKNNKVFVTGFTYSAATGYDWVTISYNASNGNENWIKTYNDPNNGVDKATDMEIDNAGNIYVSGTSANSHNNTDAYLIKYNGINGSKIREHYESEGSSYNLTSYDIARIGNNIFFSTSRYDYPYSYQGNTDLYTLDTAFNNVGSYFRVQYVPALKKIIPYSNYYYIIIDGGLGTSLARVPIGDNNETWVTGRFGASSPTNTNIFDYDIDASGNPYVLWYDTISGGAQVITFRWAKLNAATGDTIFTRVFNPTDQTDRPLQIKVGKQATPIVYITGNILKDGKIQNYTVGYNSSTGAPLWTLNQSCAAAGDKSIADMKLDNYNNIYMTGSSNCSGNDDALAVKYCASLPVANASSDKMTCAGTPIEIGGAALPNYLYSWSPAIGLSNAGISNPSASASGTYILTVTSPSGCSTNDTVMVTVNPLPNTPVITQRHDTLFSSETGTTYSWYKGASLVGSNSFYKLTSTGTYTLKITNSNNCTSLVSNTLNVTVITSVRNNSSIINSLELYPNPASQNLNINIQSKQNANAQLRIFDVSGKEMFINDIKITKGETLQKIDVSKFAKGIYVIQLTDADGSVIGKFVVK